MRKEKRDYFLKLELFRRLRKSAENERDRLILDILNETGINVSELCDVRVSHIQDNILTIPKTKNGLERKVTLSESLSSRILGFATEGYLYSSRQSERLTPRRVEQILKGISHLAGISPSITPRDLRELYVLRLYEAGIIGRDLGETLALKSIREREIPGKDEISRLISAAEDERDSLIISLIRETGATPAEISSLKAKDVREGRVRFLGTAKLLAREIPLSQALAKSLERYLDGKEGYVFSTRQSENLSTRRIEQIFAKNSMKAGLSRVITPEMARRYFAEEKLAEDPENAAKLLGISNLTLFSHGSFAKMGGRR